MGNRSISEVNFSKMLSTRPRFSAVPMIHWRQLRWGQKAARCILLILKLVLCRHQPCYRLEQPWDSYIFHWLATDPKGLPTTWRLSKHNTALVMPPTHPYTGNNGGDNVGDSNANCITNRDTPTPRESSAGAFWPLCASSKVKGPE